MDTKLIERAREGDVDAFTMLASQQVEPLFRTAMAILDHEADARVATQETLAAVWRDLPALRDPQRFDAWAGRILLNRCRQILRRRRTTLVHEIALPVPGAEGAHVARLTAARDDDRLASAELLERAFERLGADQRSLLVLHHLEHRPLDVIAEMHRVPVGTIKSRLSAARAALERALAREQR